MARVTRPDCTEWRGLMAMDAIDRVSSEESRLLEEHLSHCETCWADAHQVRGAARALALVGRGSVDGQPVDAQSLDPPSDGARSVTPGPWPALAVLPSTDEPTEGGMPGRPVRSRHRRRWVAVGTVAAAVVVAALFLVGQTPAPPTADSGAVRPTRGQGIDLVVRTAMGHTGHLAGIGPARRAGAHCLHAGGLGALVGGRQLPDSGGTPSCNRGALVRGTGEGGHRRMGPGRPGSNGPRRLPLDCQELPASRCRHQTSGLAKCRAVSH